MMPFSACASNQKNRMFARENGGRSTKKASGHSAESENVVFIVDLRNWGCDRPCNTRDGARGTNHRTGLRARGTGRECLHCAVDRAHISTLDELRPLPFGQLQREFPKASPGSRERKTPIFGGLMANGFLTVEAEKKTAVDNLGVLMREARGLARFVKASEQHSPCLMRRAG